MKAIIRHFQSATRNGMVLLERMSTYHPVATFIALSLMLPVGLLGAVAGGAVIVALPFCML